MITYHTHQKNIHTIAGHQPHYLPWLGYIDKINRVDLFCMIDTIPFDEALFQHRNKIRVNDNSGEKILEIPLQTHTKDELICNIRIDNTKPWREEHWNAIHSSYQNAPYFAKYAPFFEEVYRKEWNKLVEINEYMLKGILNFFGITTLLARTSLLGISPDQGNIHVGICKKFGAHRYVSGKGICTYLDEEALATNNIQHIIQEFDHPVYPQIHGGFVPRMAAIDLLFNCGSQSKKYIVHE